MAKTPLMAQYKEVKEKYRDCLLFYRLGDFYELFNDDALTASHELELTLRMAAYRCAGCLSMRQSSIFIG